MIARCACGRVEYEAIGRPIVSLICLCRDCQAGSLQLEGLPGAGAVGEPDGGTAYVSYRKDRIRCVRGSELLEPHKLRAGSATSRLTARCCTAPMVMWFDDARHWVPVYRARFGAAAPPPEMRICTRAAPAVPTLTDLPSYAGVPFRLLMKLATARLGMLFGG